jgi:hypothetical protein
MKISSVFQKTHFILHFHIKSVAGVRFCGRNLPPVVNLYAGKNRKEKYRGVYGEGPGFCQDAPGKI